MAIPITTNEEANKSLLASVQMSIGKLVTDVDFEDACKKFVQKGGYDFNKSLKENVKSCIQYIAIKKAKNR